ncbi:MAG TPA: hypothetical protein VNY05_10700 [Candidatus Acidoferrales bacterium]|jgi:hypothetical protein|nr:hypothetical protein [Candidatus Acidoferrales bacterium]
MNIAEMRISALRSAIQTNRVSFPGQTPCFNRSRADIQWRLVQLYFVRGWSCIQLARRYNLTRQRIEQLLAEWVDCASTLGYLQEIPAFVDIGVEISANWRAISAIANEGGPLIAGEGTGFAPVGYPVDTVRPAQTGG